MPAKKGAAMVPMLSIAPGRPTGLGMSHCGV
jgi:hypothetical protein